MFISFFIVLAVLGSSFATKKVVVENHPHTLQNRESPNFQKYANHLYEIFERAKTQFPARQQKKKEFLPYNPTLATHLKTNNNHLRTKSIEIEAWSGKVSGWFEQVFYDTTWYKDCKHPWFKENYILNTCGWSKEYGVYTQMMATANENSHQYTVTQYLYSSTDSTCSQTPWSSYEESYPILMCLGDALFHIRKEPINPATDNLKGFAMGIYNTQANCLNGDVTGLLDAGYQRLNYCWQSDDGDFLYTSCSNTDGLVLNIYTSTNGSCTGSYQTYNYYTSDYCQSPDAAMTIFGGYGSFFCEPPNN